MGDVQPLRTFGEGDALAWLQANGPVTATPTDLGRQWGWPDRINAHRALDRCEREGLIRREGNRIEAVTDVVTSAVMSEEKIPEVTTLRHAVPNIGIVVSPEYIGSVPKTPSPSIGSVVTALVARVAPVTGVVLAGIALGLAVIAVVANARHAASFDRSPDASAMLAGIGICIDLLAVVLLISRRCWRRNRGQDHDGRPGRGVDRAVAPDAVGEGGSHQARRA
jgi:DNA-binding MarR family transcriptional regulator